VSKFTKNNGHNECRTGKEGAGDTLQGRGDTLVKSIKVTSDEQKRSSVFQEKINRVTPQNWQTVPVFPEKIGVTASVAAPSDTHPSDATGVAELLVIRPIFTAQISGGQFCSHKFSTLRSHLSYVDHWRPTLGSISHLCYPTFFYWRPRFCRRGRLCREKASPRHQIRHIPVFTR